MEQPEACAFLVFPYIGQSWYYNKSWLNDKYCRVKQIIRGPNEGVNLKPLGGEFPEWY